MNLNKFINIVKPFTMTSVERITELYNSLEYIRMNNIKGDFVECGVWKGGNIIGILEYLSYHNITNVNVWLYDTFNGMTTPDDRDVDINNKKASDIFEDVKCFSSLNEVKNNLSNTKFNMNNVKFIVGDVCETLKDNNNLPNEICLLRLDTDWYESTKKEIEVLYPILVSKGVLIIDDYGHWKGSKLAIDEYFNENNIKVEIEKIDYTGIKIVKN
jgi:hypothetical protein